MIRPEIFDPYGNQTVLKEGVQQWAKHGTKQATKAVAGAVGSSFISMLFTAITSGTL